ncbi:MAG: 2-amino-4-hydroxy-6-hydroxymethyldihydropteridine diphosphokinase [Candidatus Muiribacterium halophilum]|uniref:2-amino-4-hydroxy-6-hydroxymethyldihydropteridine diphosphokinase n=1 Tax=Muiribacterium halophilum TaxID=2053465 RepID=A0A2N5Z9E3_MUIH1|nr:MAG: 2-amino-4-hydroxy-6-hydroxymethyldihydropteridine diphosphokinase [Candidatus Muirbacterium halophilum]
MKVFLLLGSNKGNRQEFLDKAIHSIENNIGNINHKTKVLETKPCGIEEQPNFLNQIIIVATNIFPTELLKEIKKIEKELGRKDSYRWGPREIDIDILFYDDIRVETSYLKIPHNQVESRDFVRRLLKDCPCSQVLS